MADVTDVQGNGDGGQVGAAGRFRPFLHRSRYRVPTSVSTLGERLVGSNSNLSALTGSAHNLLDPGKLMSMQEDARSRKISAEVMKRCLYKSVTAPCRRRIMNRMSCSSTPHYPCSTPTGSSFYSRKMLSLPVTPMQSLRVTPSQSPTEDRQFFYGFLSHGPTPRSTTPVHMDNEDDGVGENTEPNNDDEEEDKDCRGLASLFKPQPRYVVARVWTQQNCDDDDNLQEIRGELKKDGQNHSESANAKNKSRSSNSIIKHKAINLKAASPI